MPRVTVPPATANKLQLSLPVGLQLRTCTLQHLFLQCQNNQPTTKTTGTLETCLNGTVYKARGQCIKHGTQASFEQILKLLMNLCQW